MKSKIEYFLRTHRYPVITNSTKIAEALDLNPSSVRKALKSLEEEGIITRKKHDRHDTEFEITPKWPNTLAFLATSKKIITEDFARWKKKRGLR